MCESSRFTLSASVITNGHLHFCDFVITGLLLDDIWVNWPSTSASTILIEIQQNGQQCNLKFL
jgi:hypothetical protein